MPPGEEQNKSEEATPFKLARAREKGSVARGVDLGYFATLAAFLLFLALAGTALAQKLMTVMRLSLTDFASMQDPHVATRLMSEDATTVMSSLILFALTLMVLVVSIEIVQLRGLVFSAHPLKPDFTRLNPTMGLKRLISLRMLKETLKSILKFLIYGALATFAVRFALQKASLEVTSAAALATLLWRSLERLLAMFAAAALFLAAVDQLIARREFARQMRMSRSELTREYKEREGEPRIKAKRKQLHAEFLKQTESIGKLAGSDLVLVNPQHFAVALAYEPKSMAAPVVRAKARNLLALTMRAEAARLSIPVVSDPPLARTLFQSTDTGREIASDHYRAVALHYSSLRAAAAAQSAVAKENN